MAMRSKKVFYTSKLDPSTAASRNFTQKMEKQMEILRESINMKGGILDINIEEDNSQYYDNFLRDFTKNEPLTVKHKTIKENSPRNRFEVLKIKSQKKSNSKLASNRINNSNISPKHLKNSSHLILQFDDKTNKTKKSPHKPNNHRSKFKFNTQNLSFSTQVKKNNTEFQTPKKKSNQNENKGNGSDKLISVKPSLRTPQKLDREQKFENQSSKGNLCSISQKPSCIIKQNTENIEILNSDNSRHEESNLNNNFKVIEEKASNNNSSIDDKCIDIPIKKESCSRVGGLNKNNNNNDNINNNANDNNSKILNEIKGILPLIEKQINDEKYKSKAFNFQYPTQKQNSSKEEIKSKKKKFFFCCLPIK